MTTLSILGIDWLEFQNYVSLWGPLLLMGVLVYLVWRTLKLMPRTKPQQITPRSASSVTWADIEGVEETKDELREVVEFLRRPKQFKRLGATVPKGILLHGPPGTGKTLLAKAVAHESGANFFGQSASSFVEMFAGLGAARIRRLFKQARDNAPAIIFIDELDAVGTHRGSDISGERDQTLNQLLVEMDGFDSRDNVIVMAASNMLEKLDRALLRPGRFDRQVFVPPPDMRGRERILGVHTQNKPLASDVDLERMARHTAGLTGADLANLCNEAALLAARKGKRLIASDEFEEAKDKVMMGAERRSMVMTEDEKKSTAYHEAGHALVSLHVEGCDPLHKVTIIPRGRALGVTWNLPERDRYSTNMKQMKARLALCFGGRIAEQLIYGKDELNTGASNDIQQATDMARSMVMEYGMSEKLGWLRYRDNQDEVFLGHSVSRAQNMSEDTARLIDAEVRRLVEEGENVARKVLTDNLDELHLLAAALLEYETLSGEESKRAIKGEDIGREDDQSKHGTPVSGHAGSLPQIKRKPRPFGDVNPQGA